MAFESIFGGERRGRSRSFDVSLGINERARERAAAIVGWPTYIGLVYGMASSALMEMVTLLLRRSGTGGMVAKLMGLWQHLGFGAMFQSLHGLVPALAFLGNFDASGTLILASLALRLITYTLETKKPVLVGVTGLRPARIRGLAHRMATRLSRREFQRRFGGNLLFSYTISHNGRVYFTALWRIFPAANGTWSHELGHMIAYYTEEDGNPLSNYGNHPGAEEMRYFYYHIPKWMLLFTNHLSKSNNDEVFAQFSSAYMRHPHWIKTRYPRASALYKHIVNNSPAARYVQVV